ncbi:MAG: hypothetical protein KC729_10755, partial [Candidatus Eisenbacteria bacterium]|nr:hypothetical protein [Candidatus Eisenbacteria bacterium]
MANVASGQPVALPVNRPFVFGDLPKRGARICRLAMIVIGGALAVPSPGGGARADDSALLEPDRLLDLSLTDLLDVRVISAAKKEQRL